jgi:hypothetical protein
MRHLPSSPIIRMTFFVLTNRDETFCFDKLIQRLATTTDNDRLTGMPIVKAREVTVGCGNGPFCIGTRLWRYHRSHAFVMLLSVGASYRYVASHRKASRLSMLTRTFHTAWWIIDFIPFKTHLAFKVAVLGVWVALV